MPASAGYRAPFGPTSPVYRVRRFDTRLGTIYLTVPKLRNGGYVPFFVVEKKLVAEKLKQIWTQPTKLDAEKRVRLYCEEFEELYKENSNEYPDNIKQTNKYSIHRGR